jgi:uncharacterized repeat protein (TIGR01451 family)
MRGTAFREELCPLLWENRTMLRFRRIPKTIVLLTTLLLTSNAAQAARPRAGTRLPDAAVNDAPPDAVALASTDRTPANKSGTGEFTLGSAAAVTATKAVISSPPFEVGDSVFYNIVLTNNGTGTQLDNPGDEFTDTLPTGLTLVNATATSGTITMAASTVTWNGTIASSGGFFSISIEAVIDSGTAGQTLSNQGAYSYDGDGNGTNESSGTTDDPNLPGSADPTDITVGGPPSVVEVPTLSTFGSGGLAVLLAGLSIAILRRKRSA